MELLMGKFCQIFTVLSARDMPIFSFPDQGSRKLENSLSGLKIRILDQFQTPRNANNSVQQVCALNPIFSPTNQFSQINDV